MLKKREGGFTLVELLVVIAIISVIAGFLIPTLMSARGKADIVRCKSNLREIQRLGMMYADSAGTRFYPLARGSTPAAHESLNVLIRYSEGLKPALFVCPSWRLGEAEVVDGRFTLEDSTCSYTWPKMRISNSDPADSPISSDKYVFSEEDRNGHQRGRNVVFLDNSVEWINTEQIPEEELPRGLTR